MTHTDTEKRQLSDRGLIPWGISVSVSLILALAIYLWFIQSPLLAKREVVFTLIIWFVLTPLIYLLVSRFFIPHLGTYPTKARRIWLLISLGVGILFTIVTHPPQLILLQPVHQLQISVPAGKPDRSLTLEYAKTALRDIGFGEFEQQGDWQRNQTGFTHTGAEPASLLFRGRTGGSASLVFANTPGIEGVLAGWDGNLAALAPAGSPDAPVITETKLNAGWISAIFSWLLVTLTAGFFFLLITLFLVGVRIKPGPQVNLTKSYWLLYSLPMLAFWGIYLLVFFPAVMTPDSIRQWGQVITGQFNDALPVVHTLLIILLTRLWFSPAVVIVVQGIALALTVAWGIQILAKEGLPRWAGWGLVFLFAISPVNGNMMVAFWKDIPYSICLLLLSLMILKTVFSRGAWLGARFSWLWLALVSLGISLFRLNGLPVPLLSLIVLALLYRPQWRRVMLSLGVILGTWLVIQGPLFDNIKVDRNPGFKQQVFIHHIAAHIATGGPLTEEETRLASGILPLDQWAYDCCTNIPIWLQPAYSEPHFAEKAADIQKLFIDLTFKEPGVEYKHLVCVSSLVWELPNHCALKREATSSPFITWIAPNDLGLKENSLLPAMVIPLSNLNRLASEQPLDVFFYTPALFLYLGLYCTALLAYRARQPRYLLYFLPAILQSAMMLLINVSRDFRYQYGVYLAGLFSLGLLVLALTLPIYQKNHGNQETDA